MPSRNYRIPEPMVSLPIGDGRVEISVVDGEIWVSDYDSRTKRNFTIVIQRGTLNGNRCVCQAVHESAREESTLAASKRGRPKHARRIAKAHEVMAEKPPRKAGYWYQDPNSSAHGGPVVVIEQ